MCAGTCRDQKKASNPLELELRALMSHLPRTLGTKPLRHFSRLTCALPCIPPAYEAHISTER